MLAAQLRWLICWFLTVIALAAISACADDVSVPDESYFDSAGVRIHYNVYGDGPDVILIHGLTSTAADNWDTAQQVTVTGVDDAVADGDIAYNIVTAAATSTDPDYNLLDASDVGVTNTDDDALFSGNFNLYKNVRLFKPNLSEFKNLKSLKLGNSIYRMGIGGLHSTEERNGKNL